MCEVATSRRTSRRALPYARPAPANREDTPDCSAGSVGLPARPRRFQGAACSGADLRILELSKERANECAPAHLLVIDDEPRLMAEHLHRAFPAPPHRVQVARGGHAAIEYLRANAPDVIVLGLSLPDQSGLDAFRQIRSTNPRVPVIVVIRAQRADAAIEAMKDGAYDCLFKPLDLPLLRRVVNEAMDVARRMRQTVTPVAPAPDCDGDGSLVGTCPAMREVYKAIGRVAAQDVPVLITGESGTGKELVARALYRHGPRAHAPFLALNCAAIPEQLLESELFGHEKGAFTGADGRRIGKFEQCNGGTMLLDEIGDMPLALQAKILRLLQEQSFERVGGNETIRTDVRIIAATHRDLKAWSADGKFRPDLYYRLGVFTIPLPPLRERGDDLRLLVRHYLRRFSRELGRQVQEVAPEALERLGRYAWPGNIRELQSTLKQALLRASGTVLLPAFLPETLESPGKGAPASPTGEEAGADTFVLRQWFESGARDLYADTHRQMDCYLLPRVLEYTRGNIQQAALVLGIARQTLRLKLRDLGLPMTSTAEVEQVDPV
jgi:two-component system nitrogen regulation response regulator GlnG